jgi:hypothetical protein
VLFGETGQDSAATENGIIHVRDQNKDLPAKLDVRVNRVDA